MDQDVGDQAPSNLASIWVGEVGRGSVLILYLGYNQQLQPTTEPIHHQRPPPTHNSFQAPSSECRGPVERVYESPTISV